MIAHTIDVVVGGSGSVVISVSSRSVSAHAVWQAVWSRFGTGLLLYNVHVHISQVGTHTHIQKYIW